MTCIPLVYFHRSGRQSWVATVGGLHELGIAAVPIVKDAPLLETDCFCGVDLHATAERAGVACEEPTGSEGSDHVGAWGFRE